MCGIAIAFQGHVRSDIWQMFKNAAFYIDLSQETKMLDDLNNLLKLSKNSQTLQDKHTQAILYRKQLFARRLIAYNTIANFLQ
jgi:hypothetical protein